MAGKASTKLINLYKYIAVDLYEDQEKVAKGSAELLSSITPRSDEGSDHIADGWTVESDKFGHTVKNKNPRAKDPIKYSGGTTNLLSILEYGTKPHPIVPVNKKKLKFKIGGRTIFSSGVFHPGTRPYAFFSRARGAMAVQYRRIVKKTETRFRKACS